MPPRNAPGAQRGAPGGGRPPRGGAGRSVGAGRGGTSVGPALTPAAAHITTVGVRRPDYGQAGRVIRVFVNMFEATIPDSIIYHYDVISPDTLPRRMNMELIKALQWDSAPEIFDPRVSYDGKKNAFSSHRLALGPGDSRDFDVMLPEANGGSKPKRAPKVYKIKLTLVNQINPETLDRFVHQQQSNDNEVLTAIMALNVVLRMEPNLRYPFNVRSFFTPHGKRDIGGGIELWRGIFQSVRPAINRMLVNVDIATGMMYKEGPLLNLCLDFLGRPNPQPNLLSPSHGFPDTERLRLQRFIAGVRVVVDTTGERKRVVRGVSKVGANQLTFDSNGTQITVAQYFQTQLGRPLRFPSVVCVEVGKSALIPLEVCKVPPGQIMRKQVPSHKTKDVLDFSTKKPQERLDIIRQGLELLQYGQSEYIRSFGMSVNTAAGPLDVSGRVLNPPKLMYGAGSKQASVTPRDGAWNMIDKRLYKPGGPVKQWVVVVYENRNRFNDEVCRGMIQGLVTEARKLGIVFENPNPLIQYQNGQGNITAQLKSAGEQLYQQTKMGPQLYVVVLPDGGDEIYTAVKHFGDIIQGVATQCLKSFKCSKAKPQYWANVLLKVNAKLGGINVIPDTSSAMSLTDPANPTIVMGADVIHPAPGSEGRPSFTALVGSVDSHCAKYIAIDAVQTGRQEIIDDLKDMCKHVLKKYVDYREKVERQGANSKPKRLLFFRDGVSEGQFQHVLDRELPLIKEACEDMKIKCKITLVVVGKRHHIRFIPRTPQEADRSGNAPAGTVLDRDIAHPTEFDYYLQSHGGLLGTSRPSHYSVLYDENAFNADAMQALSFTLCHVYARATRSVSIPAPVYYADIVCSRAKHHYDPQGRHLLSDTATQVTTSQATGLDLFKQNFRPLSNQAQMSMFFT